MGEISDEHTKEDGPSINRNVIIVIIIVTIFVSFTYFIFQMIPQILEEFSPYDFVAEFNSKPL